MGLGIHIHVPHSIKKAVKKVVHEAVDFVGSGVKEVAGAAVGSLVPDIDMPDLPTPPAPPGEDPAARAEREAAAEEARRRSGRGRASSNPLGGIGDLSTPNLATKSLLGA